jgi:hypothetical protein
VTGLVDLEQGRLLEVVADRTRAAVDPWRGDASALATPLGHARVVVDHFHASRLANTVVDQVRRRTQQATLGHRGHKRDPLSRIPTLLLTGAEQLTSRGRGRLRAGLVAGDPGGEVVAAWQARSYWVRSMLPATWPTPGPRWSACYRWAAGVGGRSCRGWPARSGPGKPRSSPSIRPRAAPTGPPRP